MIAFIGKHQVPITFTEADKDMFEWALIENDIESIEPFLLQIPELGIEEELTALTLYDFLDTLIGYDIEEKVDIVNEFEEILI